MTRRKSILAVASSGGHLVQLRRLNNAFRSHSVTWVTTALPGDCLAPDGGLRVRDSSMWDKKGLLVTAAQVGWIVLTRRPDVIISTGAAVGLFAMIFGRIIGARTIWIDSIANASELSKAGRTARRFSSHWLTQWEHLATDDGPTFLGSVI